ncbi:Zinc/iron permease [Podospora aff. communis PSN243]|uniref:Zinc/iron permease n=1 Tax=Podospora aff. communis PSN243 TaxID=3040156 RepID=A0AAV9GA61_9PEZI|nr:Zinc/iron permease [Podospora aff. communis PSN243]
MRMETLSERAGDHAWTSIPTELLRAELLRRDDGDTRPECGSGKIGHYDTAVHVFALFLILTVSTTACAFPLVSRRIGKGGPRQRAIIFVSQHFGTGVLMATAFVHLLPTAFTSLTDPCLPRFFNKGYRPLAGLIAMISTLAVVAIESYLTTRGAAHTHSHHIWEDEDGDEARNQGREDNEVSARGAYGLVAGNIPLEDMERARLVANASLLPGSTPTHPPNDKMTLGDEGSPYADDRDTINGLDTVDNQVPLNSQASSRGAPDFKPSPGHPGMPPNAEERKRLLIQCMLLEAGILFHSVFIGMALSVATGPAFAVFLVAIALHQSFEGLALGTRIAAIQFPKSSWQPILMVLAFGATTPIGQAIGLVIHRFYDPMSQTGLLMVGIMNAISSGLLLFAGLVQLLAQDFLSKESYKTLRGSKRMQAYLSVLGGAGLMAAVGAFA